MSIIEVNNVTKEYRLGQLSNFKQSVLNAVDRLHGRLTQKQEPFNALCEIDYNNGENVE